MPGGGTPLPSEKHASEKGTSEDAATISGTSGATPSRRRKKEEVKVDEKTLAIGWSRHAPLGIAAPINRVVPPSYWEPKVGAYGPYFYNWYTGEIAFDDPREKGIRPPQAYDYRPELQKVLAQDPSQDNKALEDDPAGGGAGRPTSARSNASIERSFLVDDGSKNAAIQKLLEHEKNPHWRFLNCKHPGDAKTAKEVPNEIVFGRPAGGILDVSKYRGGIDSWKPVYKKAKSDAGMREISHWENVHTKEKLSNNVSRCFGNVWLHE